MVQYQKISKSGNSLKVVVSTYCIQSISTHLQIKTRWCERTGETMILKFEPPSSQEKTNKTRVKMLQSVLPRASGKIAAISSLNATVQHVYTLRIQLRFVEIFKLMHYIVF